MPKARITSSQRWQRFVLPLPVDERSSRPPGDGLLRRSRWLLLPACPLAVSTRDREQTPPRWEAGPVARREPCRSPESWGAESGVPGSAGPPPGGGSTHVPRGRAKALTPGSRTRAEPGYPHPPKSSRAAPAPAPARDASSVDSGPGLFSPLGPECLTPPQALPTGRQEGCRQRPVTLSR